MENYNYGNKCGHVPTSPRLYTRPPCKKKTYDILTDAQDNLRDYYYSPTKHLNKINYTRFNKKTGNGMGRQRTESREALALVAGVILDHVDLDTMNVVKYKYGKSCNISIYDIAEKANITYDRCWRALMVLQKSSYITSNQERVKQVSLKRVSLCLLHDLGISGLRVHLCRGKKHKALEKVKNEEILNQLPAFTGNPYRKNHPAWKKLLTAEEQAELKKSAEIQKKRKYYNDCALEMYRKLEDEIKAGRYKVSDIDKALNEQGLYHPDHPKPS